MSDSLSLPLSPPPLLHLHRLPTGKREKKKKKKAKHCIEDNRETLTNRGLKHILQKKKKKKCFLVFAQV